jgi:putative peptidoglycan lipid II flippase
MTALAFLGYSFAVAGYACQEIFNRVYYALKKFKVPMLVSMICVSLKLVLDFWLFRISGIIGISTSTALCLLLYAIIMGYLLRREIGNFLNRSSLYFMFQLGLPVLGMMAVILGSRYLPLSGRLAFLIPLTASGCVYLLIAYFTNIIKDVFVKEAEKVE